MHRLLDEMPELRLGGNWLEPAAGEGALLRATEIYVPKGEDVLWKLPSWTALELRKEEQENLESFKTAGIAKRVICPQDYFTWQTKAKFDVIITNPPFSLAMDFITKSIALQPKFVIMLLRLNYVGSEKRHHFMSTNMFHRTYVLPNRPPFTKNKEGKWSTDSIEYAWFVHDLSLPPTDTSAMKMLALTPKQERKPG